MGSVVGSSAGSSAGLVVGSSAGSSAGLVVGSSAGLVVGSSAGLVVGSSAGLVVGSSVGSSAGSSSGLAVGSSSVFGASVTDAVCVAAGVASGAGVKSASVAKANGQAVSASTTLNTMARNLRFMSVPPYFVSGQPCASRTVSPLLRLCTVWAVTLIFAVHSMYSLPMSAANVTVLSSGSVFSPGARGLL